MKIPEIFVPERKLDNKLEELMKEKPSRNTRISKNEIPSYALQENGDYVIISHAILVSMQNNKQLTSSSFYFTTDGGEHNLFIGGDVAKLDGKFVKVKESLISELTGLGITSSYEPDYDSGDWKLSMKHATENAYKELVKLVNNA